MRKKRNTAGAGTDDRRLYEAKDPKAPFLMPLVRGVRGALEAGLTREELAERLGQMIDTIADDVDRRRR